MEQRKQGRHTALMKGRRGCWKGGGGGGEMAVKLFSEKKKKKINKKTKLLHI